jgi:purine-binding chemotaxis protein CheW
MSGAPLARRETVMPAAMRGGSRTDRARASDGLSEFLVFLIGTERMGLPLASVQEIRKITQVTDVPRSRHDVLGILSVRGRITTVLDLRRRLLMPDVVATRQSRILLVAGADEILGLVVDEVLHVVRLRDDEIESAAVVATDLPEHVMGLGRPRRGRTEVVRGVSGARDLEARAKRGGDAADAQDAEVLVLLDPVALLRR